MEEGRIKSLRRVLETQDDQPFPYYALAIEYRNANDLENSRLFFEETLKRFPEYVPTYYHYGQLLEELGQAPQARGIYTAGLAAAQHAQDDHAYSELQAALQNIA